MIRHFQCCGNDVHKFYCCIAKTNTQRCGKEEDLAYLTFASLLPLNSLIKNDLVLGQRKVFNCGPSLGSCQARSHLTDVSFSLSIQTFCQAALVSDQEEAVTALKDRVLGVSGWETSSSGSVTSVKCSHKTFLSFAHVWPESLHGNKTKCSEGSSLLESSVSSSTKQQTSIPLGTCSLCWTALFCRYIKPLWISA